MAPHHNSPAKHQDRTSPLPPATPARAEKYFHRIHLMVPYDQSDIGQLKPSQLYTAMERLVQGKGSHVRLTNKQWFSAHFEGGMYRMAAEQSGPEQGFIIHYFLVCYSGRQKMSKEVKKGLTARFRAIAPSGTLEVEPSSGTPIRDHIEVGSEIIGLLQIPTRVYPHSKIYKSMGPDFHTFCENVAGSDGTAFGGILHFVRQLMNNQ